MKPVTALAILAAFVAILAFSLSYGKAQSDRLNTLQDCVVSTAIAERYAGDPYSLEAWQLFAPQCEK